VIRGAPRENVCSIARSLEMSCPKVRRGSLPSTSIKQSTWFRKSRLALIERSTLPSHRLRATALFSDPNPARMFRAFVGAAEASVAGIVSRKSQEVFRPRFDEKTVWDDVIAGVWIRASANLASTNPLHRASMIRAAATRSQSADDSSELVMDIGIATESFPIAQWRFEDP
jgi:hypothetical protein